MKGIQIPIGPRKGARLNSSKAKPENLLKAENLVVAIKFGERRSKGYHINDVGIYLSSGASNPTNQPSIILGVWYYDHKGFRTCIVCKLNRAGTYMRPLNRRRTMPAFTNMLEAIDAIRRELGRVYNG